MKKFLLQTRRFRHEAESDLCLPTLSECRQLDRAMKRQLEIVEQKIQVAHDRLMADANRAGLNEPSVCEASATVVLSIAASIMESASFRSGDALDGTVFIAAARAASDAALARAQNAGGQNQAF